MKSELRTSFASKRKALDPQFRQQAEKSLFEFFASLVQGAKAVWATYRAYGSELNTSHMEQQHSNVSWIYPRVEGDDLKFYQTQDFIKSDWGIDEPALEKSTAVDLDQCQGVLVPGLSFDRFGGRLGYGKGFYDRCLSSFSGLKVGVCFSSQISEESLPLEPYDIKMDLVMTEKYIIEPVSG